MTFSLSASQQSSHQTDTENKIVPPVTIRTMREDMEAIKQGGKGMVFAQSQREENSVRRMPSESSADPLARDGEKLFQRQAEGGAKKVDNPFGVASRTNTSIPGQFSQPQGMKSGLAPTTLVGELLADTSRGGKGTLFMNILIAAAALLLIAGGTYYYFLVSGKKAAERVGSTDTVQNIPETALPSAAENLVYALDKPNYLSINTETVSPLDIQKTLSGVAVRIKDSPITQPVEFLVVDQNNNPLAFSRFAFLAQFDLAPDVLALLNEAFSLYAYNDDGSIRFGLGLTFKDQTAALLAIAKIEHTLPRAFQALILDPNVNIPPALAFESNMYVPQSGGQEIPLRYANIDILRNLSIDYAVTNNRWYIGTSKNMLRAIVNAVTK